MEGSIDYTWPMRRTEMGRRINLFLTDAIVRWSKAITGRERQSALDQRHRRMADMSNRRQGIR